jgi:HIRAN domain
VAGIVLLAALVLIALAIYIALRTKSSASDKPKDRKTGDFSNAVVSQYPGSDAFDAAFEKHIAPHTNKYFNTKIAGASFPNADGSSRLSIIKKCEPMEALRLDLDPNNPVDPNAISVKRVDGSQLGYLESRVASELHQDAGKPMSWSAIFRHANRHPSTDEVVGAVIVLTRSELGPGDV